MRYLFTFDATKKQGGVQFTPVTRVAGQLYGTLALEDGADEILVKGGRFVQEITEEDFQRYERRREDFTKARNEFAMPSLNNEITPKVAVKVAASVNEVLKPKKV